MTAMTMKRRKKPALLPHLPYNRCGSLHPSSFSVATQHEGLSLVQIPAHTPAISARIDAGYRTGTRSLPLER